MKKSKQEEDAFNEKQILNALKDMTPKYVEVHLSKNITKAQYLKLWPRIKKELENIAPINES